MRIKFYGILTVCVLCCIPILAKEEVTAVMQAQQPRVQAALKTIRGKITDDKGESLIGVVVMVGDSIKAVSDIDGNFSVEAEVNSVLSFTYLGMKRYEMKVNSATKTEIEVALFPDETLIDEVVVIGYGTQSRKGLTTAVSSISNAMLNERPSAVNVLQSLAGKLAGVSIVSNSGKPGGNAAIKIRGVGSISSSNAPLYVIDGFVGGDISLIPSDNIESIDVLKDAASSAIYGARGANGVVVVTTKKGAKNSKQISFTSTFNIANMARYVDLADAYEELAIIKRSYEYVQGRVAPHLDPNNNFERKNDLFNADGTPKYNTDWQKECTRQAYSQHHSLTFQGGSQDLTALANITYKNDEGVMLNSWRKQLNVYLNLGWDLKKWLNIQTSLNAGATNSNNNDQVGITLTEMRIMQENFSFLPVKYPDGTYSRKADYPGGEDSENPVKMLNERINQTGNQFASGNLMATFHITPKIDFVSTWAAQSTAYFTFYWSGNDIRDYSERQKGYATRIHYIGINWINEDYITYRDSFKKHNIAATAGASWYFNMGTNTQTGSEGYFDNGFEHYSLQTGTSYQEPSSDYNQSTMNSYYARINYDYDTKYLLGVTARVDGSSRFGDNNPYAFFPSFSGAWLISNENFFDGLRKKINNLKIRVSYGFVGNSEIGNYRTLDRLKQENVVFDKQNVAAVTLAQLRNDDLTWEKSEQGDLGLEIGLLNNRIELIADVYRKTTRDLLYSKQLPVTTGYSTTIDNIGTVRNEGYELSLSTWNVSNRNFRWKTMVNYSHNRSEILFLDANEIGSWGGIKMKEGYPINEFWGYQRLGIWGTDEVEEAAKYGRKPGDIKYLDVNGNFMKDAGDNVPLGNGHPDFELNMSNYLTYRNFDLSFDFQCMYGNKISGLRIMLENRTTYGNSMASTLYEAWTVDNQNAIIPVNKLPSDGVVDMDADSRKIEDGSFLRLRMASLGYSFSPKILKKLKISNLHLSVTGENLLLFSKYSGYDPEVSSIDAYFNQGVDIYQYPKPRTFSLNLSLKF